MQRRILEGRPRLPAKAKELFRRMHAAIQRASIDGTLRTNSYEASRLLGIRERTSAAIIVGGARSWNCVPDGGVFMRRDGAWFTFTLQVMPDTDGSLRLESYSFQLCMPTGSAPLYLRFDLGGPDDGYVHEGLRSHLHPGASDARVPAPLLSPLELLDLFLYGLRGASGSAAG